MAAIDERVGSAELDQLAEGLATPCQIGDYTLEGLISRTSTALIFVAQRAAAGDEVVLKLSGREYGPLLERELKLLNLCRDAGIERIVRPIRCEVEWISLEGDPAGSASVSTMVLPFLAGGDLVQWIGSHATRTGRLGPHLALEVSELVGGVLRDLLRLPRPVVHGDVKPQNVMLPESGAPISSLVMIDLDASEQLDLQLGDLAGAPREIAQRLVNDVNGFGELLYILATGREPPTEGAPDPATDNAAFNALVIKCLTSETEGNGYVCMADDGIWRDIEKAQLFERTHKRARPGPALLLFDRRVLAGLGVLLLGGLIVAIASKFQFA